MSRRTAFISLIKECLAKSDLKTDNDLLTIFSENELILYLFRNKPASNDSLRLTSAGKEIFSRFYKMWDIELDFETKSRSNQNNSWTIFTSLSTYDLLIIGRYFVSPWFYDNTKPYTLWLSGDNEVSYLKLMDGNVKNFITFCANSVDTDI